MVSPPTQVLNKSSFRNDLLVAQFRNSSSNYRGIVGSRTEFEPPMMMNHARSVTVAVIASSLVSFSWKFSLCVRKESEGCPLLSPTEFNHSTSCGKLTSGHNSRPFCSGQCVITSISLHGSNPRSEGLIVCTVSSP